MDGAVGGIRPTKKKNAYVYRYECARNLTWEARKAAARTKHENPGFK